MKVLFLTKSTPVYGGVEQWLDDTCRGLELRGHECAIGLAQGKIHHDSRRYRAAHPGRNYLILDDSTGAQAGRRIAVSRVIRGFSPDVIVPVMLYDGLHEAVRLKDEFGYRLVYPVHAVYPGVTNDIVCYADWFDACVFVDRMGWSTYANFVPDQERCRMIPCGVPPASTPRVPPAADDPLRLGYVGRLEHTHKRIMDMVGLMENLQQTGLEFELLLVGEGAAERELTAALGQLPCAGRVRHVATMSRDELYQQVYPRLDALMIFSDLETGPLVAREAMVNGCVVISSEFRGCAENGILVNGVNCLLFPIGDMRAAAEKIAALAESRELREDLVSRALQCGQGFALENSVDAWEALFANLPPAPRVTGKDELPGSGQIEGRLDRLLPATWSNGLRRLFGRSFLHESAQSEWPFHCPFSCSSDSHP